jgi:octaprenyl-diphosphate synthase
VSSVLLEIQAPVHDRLERVATEMHDIMTEDLPLIQEVSKHLLKKRGKLFRPTLLLLASELEGRVDPRAVSVAASIELMHLATLVHDDSVDHSVLRRGLPTINSMFSHEISVIMGDFLYSRALSALVRIGEIEIVRIVTDVTNELALGEIEIVRIVTDVTNELALGEMRQLGAIDRLGFTEQEYLATIRSKTASLLAAACETGALCGAPRHSKVMARYGERLGMAFQIVDDIIDYTEDESVTGKPGGNDLKEHKVTLPLIEALPNMSPVARRKVDQLFHTEELNDEQVAEVIGIVAEAGGIEAARRRGEQFMQEAADALSGVPESPARTSLLAAVAYVLERRA